MTGKPVISFEEVSFSYDGKTVLKNASFQIYESDFVSIVGPNGGGKTTLLKLSMGILKPSQGKIKVFGRNPLEILEQIGYMPQALQFDPKFPISVMDVVLMGRLKRNSIGFYSKWDKQIALEAIEEVGISDLSNSSFSSLSGGQRQRVLLARTLACQPKILLLDEPTANIDLTIQQKLHRILAKLNERMTIVMVTHDFGFVTGTVNNVLCVNRRVVRHPTAEITPDSIQKLFKEDMRIVLHNEFYKNGNSTHD